VLKATRDNNSGQPGRYTSMHRPDKIDCIDAVKGCFSFLGLIEKPPYKLEMEHRPDLSRLIPDKYCEVFY
jgi:hypothetical protein